MAEHLAPELIQRHFPHRFEELPPAIFLEHYVEERTPQGRLGRKATWDRLSFHSWAPRRVWLSGRERIAFGDPHWEHLPEHEVEALLGREEMQALPPDVPQQDDQPWTGVPAWALTAELSAREAARRYQEPTASPCARHRAKIRVRWAAEVQRNWIAIPALFMKATPS